MPVEPMLEQAETQQDSISSNEEQVEPGTQGSEPQPGQTDTSQNWNPQEWALNFRGQQIYPKDRQHLVNLAQKGYSYEGAMEQLNQERQRISQMQGEYQRYTQLDEALKGNPQFAQQLWNFVQEQQKGQQQGQQQQQQGDPQVLQLQSELEEIKTWKQQVAEQQASQAIDRELSDIAAQYPQFDWQADDGSGSLAWKVMNHAYQNNISSMKSAFRDLMFDVTQSQVKLDTLKQQKEKQQQQFRQGVVQSGGASTAPAGPGQKQGYSRSDDYSDLAQKALNALGG